MSNAYHTHAVLRLFTFSTVLQVHVSRMQENGDLSYYYYYLRRGRRPKGWGNGR